MYVKTRNQRRPNARPCGLGVLVLLIVFSAAAVSVLLTGPRRASAEEIKLKDGTTVQGKIVERTDDYVKVRVKVGRIEYTKKIYMRQIDKIVSDGAAGEPEPEPEPGPKPGPKPEPKPEPAPEPVTKTRTATEVERLIRTVGATKPDWWDQVEDNWPKTLDLTWKQTKGWDPTRKLGQYMVQIRRQPQSWKPAVKLMYEVLEVNRRDASKTVRTQRSLAFLYKSTLGDYARAAYWLKKVKASRIRKRVGDYVDLADCYFRLGCTSLAERELRRLPSTSSIPLSSTIRLLGRLDRQQRAKSLAAVQAKGRFAGQALLAYADACRTLGEYDDAIAGYKKLLRMPGGRWVDTAKKRATASLEAVEAFKDLDITKVPDGEYRAESRGYRGPVEVRVVMSDGRIDRIHIGRHKEDWFIGTFILVPEQIIQTQSLKGIDAVSRATVTSEAVLNATGKALAKGAK